MRRILGSCCTTIAKVPTPSGDITRCAGAKIAKRGKTRIGCSVLERCRATANSNGLAGGVGANGYKVIVKRYAIGSGQADLVGVCSIKMCWISFGTVTAIAQIPEITHVHGIGWCGAQVGENNFVIVVIVNGVGELRLAFGQINSNDLANIIAALRIGCNG